ncbi:TniB family NTP-binding protein [Propionivibrio dicarboxylicus]|uniref:AAA domain-containing protein n=1 Tax=Propionivibrio dicarboxylicus TaxID=83767 RepID=A0A1G7VA06_9RHOO|nr:TniB family NTP-binding protein [Propionivibrio dicarboxylicus]SDG56371.1 AAA domain-containing protein [Propionivibrio dicarboxylicus]
MGAAVFQTKSIFQGLEKAQPKDLAPDDRRLLALRGTEVERAEFTRVVSIAVPSYRRSMKFMETLLEKSDKFKSPGGLWIFGGGGEGKSFILQAFLCKHLPVETTERYVCPVLYLRFDGRPAESEIYLSILLKLGQNPESVRFDSNSKLRQLASNALKQCNVKIILFDEAQHLFLSVSGNRTRDRFGGVLGDSLKTLYDQLESVAFVFAGTPGLEAILADTQISTRWPGTLKLESFKYDEIFIGLLGALDSALPMEELSGLADEELSKKIYETCGGNFRRLKNFLADAVAIAASAGAKSISMVHFAKAHFQIFCVEQTPFGLVDI